MDMNSRARALALVKDLRENVPSMLRSLEDSLSDWSSTGSDYEYAEGVEAQLSELLALLVPSQAEREVAAVSLGDAVAALRALDADGRTVGEVTELSWTPTEVGTYVLRRPRTADEEMADREADRYEHDFWKRSE